MTPPRSVHLPTGRVVEIEARPGLVARAPVSGGPLFAEAIELVTSGDLVLRERGAPVDVLDLHLCDFHALRAIGARLGWLAEQEIEILCRNCEAPIRHAPCAALALGPFVDGELTDPILDRTLDLSASHAVPEIRLRGGRTARGVRLAALNVGRAAPLHRALGRRRLVLTGAVVQAMGIAALGPERNPGRIAAALARCPDAAWGRICDLFLLAHYPPRLSALAVCPRCGARSDVDAPYDREFEPSETGPASNAELFPDFEVFAVRAQAMFEERSSGTTGTTLLAVDAGVPACDDGGEPLLGSYAPAGGEPTAPVGAAEITVYYRTFRAAWDEEGPYDWEAELDETIEHELEHHAGWLVGHDPMDDEERAELGRERARTVGRKAVARESLGAFGADIRSFVSHTWPIWLIVAAATVAATVCSR